MNRTCCGFPTLLFLMIGLTLSKANSQNFLTDGLVSFYSFNGNANDAVGTNHGIVVGATLAPDMFGTPNRAYSFNGTNSWILCPDADFPSGNSPRTVSLWISFRSYGV